MNPIKFGILRNLFMSFFLGGVFIVIGSFNCMAWSQEVYKIGVILPITGPMADIGLSQQNVLEMIKNEINIRGGINQRDLQLIIMDTSSKPIGAVHGIEKLISEDVISIIGPSSRSSTHAIMQIANKKRMPLISLAPDANFDISNSSGSWVFKTAPKVDLRIRACLNSLREQSITNFILTGPSYLLSTQFIDQVNNVAMSLNINRANVLPYKKEFSAGQIMDLLFLRAPNQVVLFYDPFLSYRIGESFHHIFQISQTMSQSQPNSIYFLGAGINPDLYKFNLSPRLIGNIDVKLVVPTYLFPGLLPSSQSEQIHKINQFAGKYMEEYNERVTVYQFYAHDALRLLEKALLSTNTDDRQRIRDNIMETRTFEGLVGRYNFSSSDKCGLIESIFGIAEKKEDGCPRDEYPCEGDCEKVCCKENGC